MDNYRADFLRKSSKSAIKSITKGTSTKLRPIVTSYPQYFSNNILRLLFLDNLSIVFFSQISRKRNQSIKFPGVKMVKHKIKSKKVKKARLQ